MNDIYFDSAEMFEDLAEQLAKAEEENAMLRRVCQAYDYGLKQRNAEIEALRQQLASMERQFMATAKHATTMQRALTSRLEAEAARLAERTAEYQERTAK